MKEQGEQTYIKQIVEPKEDIHDITVGEHKTILHSRFIKKKSGERLLTEINKYSNREPLIGFEMLFDGNIIQYQLPNKRTDTLVARLTQYNKTTEMLLNHLGL